MPISLTQKVSAGTLEIMDDHVLESSKLSEARQQEIREHFQKVLLSTQSEAFHYTLHFRQFKDVPNAFALPSGDIVISDALIKLAERQEEIDAVLLHEIGHVVHRHGLQQIIHSSVVTIAVTMIAGDATAIQDMVVALPVFLLQSSYSRENESDADEYAFEQMVKLGIDPIYFASMFEKMTEVENADADKVSSKDGIEDKKDSQLNTSAETIEKYSEFISTHPSSPHRMQRAREYSAKYFHK